MIEYFILQYKLTNRKFKDFGLKPIFGYLIILTFFFASSIYIFSKTEFAQYAFVLISLVLTSKLSEIGRNDFLRMCFNSKQYRLLRVVENLITSLPFLIFLVYKQCFGSPILLFVFSVLLSFGNFKTTFIFVVPTPFYQKPFEFIVGFRNTFFIFLIAYILTFISISVNNFSLGIFSLTLVFLTIFGFFLTPENEYYVWSFAMTSKQFLLQKIKTALFFSTILCMPIFIALCIFYYINIEALLALYTLGLFFMATIILVKYSAYPDEINLKEAILIASSIGFPPMLFATIPYFYKKSLRQLEKYLK